MGRVRMQLQCIKRTIAQFKNMYLAMNGKINSQAHYLAMMIKHIHSIEKGLAMQNIRPGFGLPRIDNLLTYLEKYLALTGNMDSMECGMAYSVVLRYIEHHENIEFSNSEYDNMKRRVQHLFEPFKEELSKDAGGVLDVNFKEITVDLNAFEYCVLTRHSIRDFCGEPVPEEMLRKAIALAMHAPSACNRQTTRVYILDRSKFDSLGGWTGGVKTFLDSVDKMLIITSQMSAYEKDEFWQYSVSASIFAGYLTLSLHAVGLGACLLQRPLVSDGQWKRIAKNYNIPSDEQVVCAMAVGVPCDEVKVPLSQRLEYERVVKNL